MLESSLPITWLIYVFVIVTAISTNLFPILYSRVRWAKTKLGRALMINAVASAIFIDVFILFYLWFPEADVVYYVVYAMTFGFLAFGRTTLTWVLISYQKPRRSVNKKQPQEIS